MPLSFLVPEEAAAANITIEVRTFGNGAANITPEFMSMGMDNSNSLSLQTGLFVDEARLKLHSVAPPPGEKSYPSNITIDFGGDGLLEWKWVGNGIGQLGMQDTFVTGKKYLNYTIPSEGGTNNTAAIMLPRTAKVTSAVWNVTSGSSGMGNAGKVLIVGAASPNYNQDIKNKLMTFPDVTQVDIVQAQSSTPALDTLKQYNAAIVLSDYGFTDSTTLGNNLADYVDAGGGVVMGLFTCGAGSLTPGGRFTSGGYNVIPTTGYQYSSGSLGTINVPGHPLMKNVNTFSTQNYRTSSTVVTAGSVKVASYSDNYVLVGAKEINGVQRVDLGFYPPSSDVLGSWNSGTDGKHLIHNAVQFAGKHAAFINCSMDIGNDGILEWKNETLNVTEKLPDMKDVLNNYLADAQVSTADPYGNQFVNIPIALISNASASLQLANMTITYDYETDILENPAMGNFTMSLADIVPTSQGSNNASIPIVINTASAGRFKLDDLYIRLTPPRHAATIRSFFPPLATTVPENSIVDFGVNATDIYGNPTVYQWYFDGVAAGDGTDRYTTSFDFDSAGDHTVRIEIQNGLKMASMDWKINVKNVDRGPIIEQMDPAAESWKVKEGSNYTFSVSASDLDEDPLSYAWVLDGSPVPKATGPNYTYFASFTSAGDHKLKVTVSDPSALSESMTWTVQVENVNQAPLITDWYPKDDPKLQETQSWTFGVSASDPDDQPLTIKWYLDDDEVFRGNPYKYVTDYRSAGVHAVKAVVSDGSLSAIRQWKATVSDLNRLPAAIIDAPKSMQEFMEGATIHFSAKSSYDPDGGNLSFGWKESGAALSDQAEFDRPFLHGIHTVVLEVSDGLGGTNQSAIHFKVHWVELSLVMGLDQLDIVDGEKVQVIITLTNVGDTNSSAGDKLELLVDGRAMDSSNLASVTAGEATRLQFTWKATKGSHTLTAKIGEQTWNKPVTVAAAPAEEEGLSADILMPVLIVIVAVVLAAWGFMALRKK